MGKARNVIISGLTAAGKTTHAKLLCRDYGFRYVSASQILLNLAGLKQKQPLDFWVTPKGREIQRRISWSQIDNEFRRIESESDNTMFDCQSLPWLSSKECMIIWLESSLRSRVMKAIVSYQGQSNLTTHDIENGVKSKDRFGREQILANYKIDLFRNRKPFNFIIDISSFITAPTEEASQTSIIDAHKVISTAVGWYLNNDEICREEFKEFIAAYHNKIITRYPLVI